MDTCGNGPRIHIGFNVCYGNGGRGVYACASNNCDFVNNTCYNNIQDSTLYSPTIDTLGELAVGDGSNNTFTNNIAYAHGGIDNANIVFTFPGSASVNNIFNYNCYYSGSATYGTGDIYANPMFINAAANDFRLVIGSPAAGDGAFPTPIGLSGTYTLTPANASGSRLDAYGSGTANGTNVDIWANNGTAAQKWVFTNEGGNIYKIQPSYNLGLCLDVIAGGSSGTNCDLYQDNGTNAQRWTVNQNSDGTYTIVPQCAPTCALDVHYSGTSNGTQVDIYTANGTNAQKWTVSH
jgi:hypothetical protein